MTALRLPFFLAALALAGCATTRPAPVSAPELTTLAEVNAALARRPAVVDFVDGREEQDVYVVVGPRETRIRGKKPPLYERDRQPVRIVDTDSIASIWVRPERGRPTGGLHLLCIAPGALGACVALNSDGSDYCATDECLLPGLGIGALGFVLADAVSRSRRSSSGLQEVYRGPVTRYTDAAASLRRGVGLRAPDANGTRARADAP